MSPQEKSSISWLDPRIVTYFLGLGLVGLVAVIRIDSQVAQNSRDIAKLEIRSVDKDVYGSDLRSLKDELARINTEVNRIRDWVLARR